MASKEQASSNEFWKGVALVAAFVVGLDVLLDT